MTKLTEPSRLKVEHLRVNLPLHADVPDVPDVTSLSKLMLEPRRPKTRLERAVSSSTFLAWGWSTPWSPWSMGKMYHFQAGRTNRAKPIANALAGAEDQMIPKMNPEVSHIPVIIWFYHHLYLIWNPSIGLEYINWNLLCNWQWKVHHVMGFCEQYSACILGHRFSIADSSLHHLTNFGHVVSRKNDHTLINV